MPHAAVNPKIRSRAKVLRQGMTRAETLLWRYLKAHRIDGLGFRRQVPFRHFVADFACHAARIIVELDGETHDFVSRQNSDKARDVFFRSQGYLILRFANDDVLKDLAGVIEAIRNAAVPRHMLPPSLTLRRKGGGSYAVAGAPVSASAGGNAAGGAMPAITNNLPSPLPEPPPQGGREPTGARSKTAS